MLQWHTRRNHLRRNHRHHQLSEPLVPESSSEPRSRIGSRHSSDLRRQQRWDSVRTSREIELGQYRPPTSSTMIPTLEDGKYVMPSTSSNRRTTPKSQSGHRHKPLSPTPIRNHHGEIHLSRQQPFEDLSWSICSHGFCCVQCVRTQELGIAENFGAFDEIVGPGLYLTLWPCSSITSRLSLRIQQVDVTCETKSLDNVFFHITVCVQYRVIVERAYEANYRLSNVERQLQTLVYSIVRSKCPRMTIERLFESKSDVSDAVFIDLVQPLKDYGYQIVETLVTRITPNEKVKSAMNEINASRRIKESIPHRAEAEKMSKIKQAEAKAETLHLHGTGIANQRQAIVQGMKEAVNKWTLDQTNVKSEDVMSLLLLSQYMDTLVAVGANSLIVHASTTQQILSPSPGARVIS